jgi:hypothetical protein
MKRSIQALLASMCVLLASCGGGGGGATPLRVTLDTQSVSATVTPSSAPASYGATVAITLDGTLPADLHFQVQTTYNGLRHAMPVHDAMTPRSVRLQVSFRDASAVPDGRYDDTITLRVWTNADCSQQATGSPFTIAARLDVSGSAQTVPLTVLPAPPAPLTHDVIEARYSRALDAVVMTTTLPDNALVVHDLATGTERKVALPQAPVTLALALSPDGSHAVVGYAQALTWIDLTTLDAPGGPSMRTIDTDVTDFTFALDANDWIYLFPRVYALGDSTFVRTIDVSTGAYAVTSTVLHTAMTPQVNLAGTSLYATGGTVGQGWSRYAIDHGSIALADQIPTDTGTAHVDACCATFLSDDGTHALSQMGFLYATTDDASTDMASAGSLPDANGVIVSDARFVAATDTLATIESYDSLFVEDWRDTLVHLYTLSTLAPGTRYWFPPVVDGEASIDVRAYGLYRDASGRLFALSVREGDAPGTIGHHYLQPVGDAPVMASSTAHR